MADKYEEYLNVQKQLLDKLNANPDLEKGLNNVQHAFVKATPQQLRDYATTGDKKAFVTAVIGGKEDTTTVDEKDTTTVGDTEVKRGPGRQKMTPEQLEEYRKKVRNGTYKKAGAHKKNKEKVVVTPEGTATEKLKNINPDEVVKRVFGQAKYESKTPEPVEEPMPSENPIRPEVKEQAPGDGTFEILDKAVEPDDTDLGGIDFGRPEEGSRFPKGTKSVPDVPTGPTKTRIGYAPGERTAEEVYNDEMERLVNGIKGGVDTPIGLVQAKALPDGIKSSADELLKDNKVITYLPSLEMIPGSNEWSMEDKQAYSNLRRMYNPPAAPPLYQQVNTGTVPPPNRPAFDNEQKADEMAVKRAGLLNFLLGNPAPWGPKKSKFEPSPVEGSATELEPGHKVGEGLSINEQQRHSDEWKARVKENSLTRASDLAGYEVTDPEEAFKIVSTGLNKEIAEIDKRIGGYKAKASQLGLLYNSGKLSKEEYTAVVDDYNGWINGLSERKGNVQSELENLRTALLPETPTEYEPTPLSESQEEFEKRKEGVSDEEQIRAAREEAKKVLPELSPEDLEFIRHVDSVPKKARENWLESIQKLFDERAKAEDPSKVKQPDFGTFDQWEKYFKVKGAKNTRDILNAAQESKERVSEHLEKLKAESEWNEAKSAQFRKDMDEYLDYMDRKDIPLKVFTGIGPANGQTEDEYRGQVEEMFRADRGRDRIRKWIVNASKEDYDEWFKAGVDMRLDRVRSYLAEQEQKKRMASALSKSNLPGWVPNELGQPDLKATIKEFRDWVEQHPGLPNGAYAQAAQYAGLEYNWNDGVRFSPGGKIRRSKTVDGMKVRDGLYGTWLPRGANNEVTSWMDRHSEEVNVAALEAARNSRLLGIDLESTYNQGRIVYNHPNTVPKSFAEDLAQARSLLPPGGVFDIPTIIKFFQQGGNGLGGYDWIVREIDPEFYEQWRDAEATGLIARKGTPEEAEWTERWNNMIPLMIPYLEEADLRKELFDATEDLKIARSKYWDVAKKADTHKKAIKAAQEAGLTIPIMEEYKDAQEDYDIIKGMTDHLAEALESYHNSPEWKELQEYRAARTAEAEVETAEAEVEPEVEEEDKILGLIQDGLDTLDLVSFVDPGNSSYTAHLEEVSNRIDEAVIEAMLTNTFTDDDRRKYRIWVDKRDNFFGVKPESKVDVTSELYNKTRDALQDRYAPSYERRFDDFITYYKPTNEEVRKDGIYNAQKLLAKIKKYGPETTVPAYDLNDEEKNKYYTYIRRKLGLPVPTSSTEVPLEGEDLKDLEGFLRDLDMEQIADAYKKFTTTAQRYGGKLNWNLPWPRAGGGYFDPELDDVVETDKEFTPLSGSQIKLLNLFRKTLGTHPEQVKQIESNWVGQDTIDYIGRLFDAMNYYYENKENPGPNFLKAYKDVGNAIGALKNGHPELVYSLVSGGNREQVDKIMKFLNKVASDTKSTELKQRYKNAVAARKKFNESKAIRDAILSEITHSGETPDADRYLLDLAKQPLGDELPKAKEGFQNLSPRNILTKIFQEYQKAKPSERRPDSQEAIRYATAISGLLSSIGAGTPGTSATSKWGSGSKEDYDNMMALYSKLLEAYFDSDWRTIHDLITVTDNKYLDKLVKAFMPEVARHEGIK